MTNDQILHYLNSFSFLSFSEWRCYPSFTNDSLFYFSPADNDRISIKQNITEGIATILRDKEIKEDELKQEIEWYKKGVVPKYWKERHKGNL